MKQLFILIVICLAGLKIMWAQGTATGVISYTETITLGTDQTEVSHTWTDAFSNEGYFLYVNAWHEEVIDGKTVQVQNGIYDFTKTTSGFSLKLKNPGGKLTYYAVEATQSAIASLVPHTQSFVAAQGQTRFTLDNAPLLVWVWLNGLLQYPSEWSIEDSDIVFANGTSADDQVGVYYIQGTGNQTENSDTTNYVLTVTEKYLNDANTSNSGSVLKESQQYDEGASVSLTTDFPNEGDNFQGYTLNVDGSNPSLSLNVTITESTEIFAVYDYTEQTSSSSLLDGLIAAYEFNETGGTELKDLSPNNLDGTVNGALIDQEGILGRGYLFDGVDDHVELPDSDLLEWGSSLTISAWVKTTTDGRWQAITQREKEYGDQINAFSFDANLNILFKESQGNSGLWSTSPLTLNQWCHALAILDGTNRKIYINGALVGSDSNGSQADVITEDNFDLGSTISSINRDRFKGYMDCFHIWNRALTEQEIQELYNSGNGIAYPFDGSTGGTTAPNYTLTVSESYLNDATSSNSGSVSPESETYDEGTSVTVGNDFTNTGDNFSGFFWNSDGTNPVTSFDITQDTTIFAVYDYTNPPSSTLLNGLVARWEFNEDTGTTLEDESPNSLNGTNYGATINQSGIIDNAYLFDGTDDYVSVDDNDALSCLGNNQDLTIAITVDLLTVIGTYKYLLWKDDEYCLFLYNSELNFRVENGSGYEWVKKSGLTMGTHQLVAYYDSSTGDLYLYVDGQLFIQQNRSVASDYRSNFNTPLLIGKASSNSKCINAVIDDVTIWDRVLTADEIQELYNSGNGNAYPFDGSSGGATAQNYALTVSESYINDATSSNSGSVSPGSETYEEGTSVTVGNDFTNTGDNFEGFFWNSDGTNPVTSFDINQDTTVYAVYDYTNPPASTLLNGLVSCWEFDEISGTNAIDSHGANDGAIVGASIGQPGFGNLGYSYEFKNDGYVNVSTIDFASSKATLLAWVNITSMGSMDGIIFDRKTSATGININNEKLGYHWNDAYNTWSWESGLAIPLNNWCLLVLVVSDTEAKMYLGSNNSVNVAVNNVAHSIATLSNLFIGEDPKGYRQLDGKIAQVAIWNRPLTEQEIQEIYNSGNGNAYPFNQ